MKKGQVLVDITGKKFYKLTAVRHHHADYWEWKCDCGGEKISRRSHVQIGNVQSCGCYRKEYRKKQTLTHGMARTHFYHKWTAMKSRCSDPKVRSYKDYGGRDIRCLWVYFEDFYRDMHESYLEHVSIYGEHETTIDRIDNNGNYCRENCRWATFAVQALNRRIPKECRNQFSK